ncbi:exosortase F system-associated membrane protein [Flavobacterium sp. RHBU_3]|uniref:exosortase F system-associated membrane protein n=1 Tax=Flavobacterium sp. RHBU_3 TaxID=3391184 RepID=UPI0039846BF4
MQKKLTLSPLNWAGIALLLVLIVCVRIFEQSLFYDPLLAFYKHTGKTVLPPYHTGLLLLGYAFRYALNTILSLGILWLAFKDMEVIKVTAILYVVLLAVFLSGLYILLSLESPPLKGIFYLRRFLMQPMLLLLFVPAFYYQKHLKA